MGSEEYIDEGYSKLDSHLERQAQAATDAANHLFSLGAYGPGAALLRSVGAPEELTYEAARGYAYERGEEDAFMDDLYGDLFPEPS